MSASLLTNVSLSSSRGAQQWQEKLDDAELLLLAVFYCYILIINNSGNIKVQLTFNCTE
jgi:hypothetical protein